MRPHIPFVAALVLASAGCSDLLETDGVDSAVVTVDTYIGGGPTNYVIAPLAFFYADANLTYFPPSAGVCGTLQYDPNAPTGISGGRTMDAGPFLLSTLPTRQDTLYLQTEFGIRFYRPGHLGGFVHSPGDTLTITVPGTGSFPATSIAIRTAEEFAIDPVTVPAINEPLLVTWQSSTTVPGSVIQYSLRYANENSTGALNEQLLCYFADDGEGTIDPMFLQGWVNAVGGQRQVAATRIRSREIQVNDKSTILVLSTFQVPTPPLNQ